MYSLQLTIVRRQKKENLKKPGHMTTCMEWTANGQIKHSVSCDFVRVHVFSFSYTYMISLIVCSCVILYELFVCLCWFDFLFFNKFRLLIASFRLGVFSLPFYDSVFIFYCILYHRCLAFSCIFTALEITYVIKACFAISELNFIYVCVCVYIYMCFSSSSSSFLFLCPQIKVYVMYTISIYDNFLFCWFSEISICF